MEWSGRTAVVTGGASGIGLGMCRAFAQRGANLVIADLNEEAMAAACSELNGAGVRAIYQACDVSKLEQVEALAQRALEEFGAVHVLCNNAGVGIPTSIANMKLEDWRWIMDVDLWGPIYGLKVFLPLIEAQGEGHVCSTSSMAGLISSGPLAAYNVAKHGVVALMAVTERDLRRRKSPVTASVLCPGPINTNISFNSVTYRPGGKAPKTDGEQSAKAAQSIQDVLEKGMQPDEVGELVATSIDENKFWILTHPWYAKAMQKQLDALVEDQTLTKA